MAKETDEVQAAEDQEQESADIVIFCHPRNVSNLVQAFEDQIKHAAGELPMFVLWSGVSGVLHQGVIVLEWQGTITPEFLYNLSIDHEIFDYAVYEWTAGNDQGEQTGNAQESGDEIKGRQFVQ